MVTESDTHAEFRIGFPGAVQIDDYYRAVDAVRPLLNLDAWQRATTGHYVYGGVGNCVRIQYFATEKAASNAREIAIDFINDHGLEIRHRQGPSVKRFSETYGGNEDELRQFIVRSTAIGLDLTAADQQHARWLMVAYRFQVTVSGGDSRAFLEQPFNRSSSAYRQLTDPERDALWSKFSFRIYRNQVDWAHFIVMTVLAADWDPGDFRRAREQFGDKMNIGDINKSVLNGANPDLPKAIPHDWVP